MPSSNGVVGGVCRQLRWRRHWRFLQVVRDVGAHRVGDLFKRVITFAVDADKISDAEVRHVGLVGEASVDSAGRTDAEERIGSRGAIAGQVGHAKAGDPFGPAFVHDRYRHTVGVSVLEDFVDLLAEFVDGLRGVRFFLFFVSGQTE